MKSIFIVGSLFSLLLIACGENEEDKKELCDCLEDGRIVQTDECREIAGYAKANEIEACETKNQ